MEDTEYEQSWDQGPLEDAAAQAAARKKRRDAQQAEDDEFAAGFNGVDGPRQDPADNANQPPADAAQAAADAQAAGDQPAHVGGLDIEAAKAA